MGFCSLTALSSLARAAALPAGVDFHSLLGLGQQNVVQCVCSPLVLRRYLWLWCELPLTPRCVYTWAARASCHGAGHRLASESARFYGVPGALGHSLRFLWNVLDLLPCVRALRPGGGGEFWDVKSPCVSPAEGVTGGGGEAGGQSSL